jgi:hypothetical protein
MTYFIIDEDGVALSGGHTQADIDLMDPTPLTAPVEEMGVNFGEGNSRGAIVGNTWNGTSWSGNIEGQYESIDRIRELRDSALLATDYTQLPDYSGTLQVEFATYRQELRDLPSTYVEGEAFVWSANDPTS